jgi:hypothetical protein
MRALFFAHSGLRYLVLLAGLIALVYAARAVLSKQREGGSGSRISTAAFLGLLDLQIVLGLILASMGVFYAALAGHFITMLVAAGVGHATSLYARRSGGEKADQIRLIGLSITLLLIVLGIVAIGRSVFGTSTPSF